MNWDYYFQQVCYAISLKSPCLSRNVGALLVRDHSIVSTGYNGPPRGVPHCEGPECPRKTRGAESLHLCPAQHAEENAVSNAARIGASTIGCTLYLNSIIPCSKCFGTLINAGVVEVVCMDMVLYDPLTSKLINNSPIKVRTFI